MTHAFPLEFDVNFYRKSYSDLSEYSDEFLSNHYRINGIKEGRIGSPAALREEFTKLIGGLYPILEIGPFVNPLITGDNVFYFDVMNQESLNRRAINMGIVASAPYIDYVSSIGDLSIIDRRFSSIISSHCIEHQPDLIGHLRQVSTLLLPGGFYFLLIPDKRYCFDHFLSDSSVADVLDAFERKQRVHSLASVIEHRALTTHNDCIRHWTGDHVDQGHISNIASKSALALKEYNAANGGYIDVHAWQFTPNSFRLLMDIIFELGFSGLRPVRVYETPRDRLEFAAILKATRASD